MKDGWSNDADGENRTMIIYFIIPAIFMILVGIYIYHLINRLIGFYFSVAEKNRKRISITLSLLIMIPSLNIWSLQAVVVLYVAGVSCVIDLIWYIFRKVFKKENHILRVAYEGGIVLILVTSIILGYGYNNMYRVVKTEYTVTSEKIRNQDGYTIVFLSDLHYGTTMDKNQLEKYCRQMEECQPDAVVLGGDIVDENTTKDQMKEAFQTLGGIQTTYGIYYVYGNHDKNSYSMHPQYFTEELDNSISKNSITILEDTTKDLNEELSITGRRDLSDMESDKDSRKSSSELLKNEKSNGIHIVVDHQPRQMQENAEAGYDLMLAGHTHAGQVWPVGLLTELFVHGTINYGLENVQNMNIIVSSGISGWGYPIRTEKHCEFDVIHIKQSKKH